MWDNFKGEQNILATKIDKFVGTSLQKVLFKDNAKKGNRIPDKNISAQNYNRYNYKKNKVDRNLRRRYLYARCQDMFKECPKKLADVVMNDVMAYLAPARQPSEANEIDKLYKNLWGKEGLSDPPTPPNSASVITGLLHEYFPPVIAGEIVERIKKIRNKTAAGPNGIEKKHLAIPGLDIILALLFNMLCYISHYPESWRKNRTVLIPKPNKDQNKAENWRPIAIGPILARIFFSILGRRIRT